ncbi:MAG: nodulation protein NfeD [Nitrososphaerota archaeon]|nr:nodulation protein NfeD [Nitrososphaerota archaeon]
MKRLRLVIAVALLLALAAQAFPAHGQQSCSSSGGYYVASLNAGIDPGAADFMSITVSNAESLCAHTIVFVLNTNGGDGTSMESMVGSIQSYQAWGGTFITLVAPQTSHAWSAGSYIAEASTQIVMVNGTSIGAATPIVSGIPTGEENGTYSKDIGAFSQYMYGLASANHRNATAAARMVTIPAQTYSDQDALALGVVNSVIDTNTVQGALSALGVPANAPVNTPGVRSSLISVLSNPNVSSLLFLVGVFLVMADIYHPTIILSVIGVVVIAMALFGLGVFGASPLAVLMMIIGAAFIFLEVKTQHGISALAGVAIFIVGFLLIYQLPPSAAATPSTSGLPPANFSGIPDITYGLIVGLGAAIVIASLYLRSIREGLKSRPRVNEPSVLIGREGKMESDLKAGGKGVAEVSSEEWTVTAALDLKRGDVVRVKEVQGNTLVVEKKEN